MKTPLKTIKEINQEAAQLLISRLEIPDTWGDLDEEDREAQRADALAQYTPDDWQRRLRSIGQVQMNLSDPDKTEAMEQLRDNLLDVVNQINDALKADEALIDELRDDTRTYFELTGDAQPHNALSNPVSVITKTDYDKKAMWALVQEKANEGDLYAPDLIRTKRELDARKLRTLLSAGRAPEWATPLLEETAEPRVALIKRYGQYAITNQEEA